MYFSTQSAENQAFFQENPLVFIGSALYNSVCHTDLKEANAMASRKRIVLCYVLLQASFWGMISSICAYQAAIVLDRGFTTGQAGIFCALCYLASLFTQPVIGAEKPLP